MKRLDWEARLAALIEARMDEPFRWGTHDCGLWGADAVEAQTGIDFAAGFRGTYSDAAGAAEALRTQGAGTIVKTFDQHLKRVPPAFAQRGDIVLKGRGRTAAIGLCIGGEALFVSDEGLVRVGRGEWSAAWRVAVRKWFS